MGKKRQKKSGTSKKRNKHRKRSGSLADGADGLPSDGPIVADAPMSNMVGGFRRAVGVEKSAPDKRGWMDGALLWLLVIAVIGVVAWRFLE